VLIEKIGAEIVQAVMRAYQSVMPEPFAKI
jgi:hypothetical protein